MARVTGAGRLVQLTSMVVERRVRDEAGAEAAAPPGCSN